jgi:hypothetical protein
METVITVKISHFGHEGEGFTKAVKVPSEDALPGMSLTERCIWALKSYAYSTEFRDTFNMLA